MSEVKKWYLATVLLLLGSAPLRAEVGELRILVFAINGQQTQVVAPVLLVDGAPHMTPDVFERLRIRLPDVVAILHEGARYYPLGGHAGTSFRISERDQAIDLEVPSAALMSTTLEGQRDVRPPPTPSDPGGFLNYDVLGERLDGSVSLDSFVELGLYGGEFVFTQTQVLEELDDEPNYLRLDSTLVHDVPEDRMTYRLGDSISRGGQWGRPVRFGGIQVGTNFATQPDFVTFPTVTITGDAALPSSVDVIAANSSRFRDEIPSGPFVIEDLPVVTGAGEVTAVVTDVLGRETIISQDYYTSPELLRAGLHDFSVELGLPRQDFGEESNEYDDEGTLLSGTYRYGWSDNFTGELHGEFDWNRQAVGFGFAAPVDVYGVVDGAVAGSLDEGDRGGLLQLGFERSAGDISIAAFGRMTIGDYTDLGVDEGLSSSDREGRLRLSVPLGGFGSLSGSYTYRDFDDDPNENILTGTYSLTVRQVGTLNVTAFSTFGGDNETVVSANLTIPLGPRSNVSGGVQARAGSEYVGSVQARHTAPLEGGFGGFGSLTVDGFTRAEGAVSYTSGFGEVSAAGSWVDDDGTGVRLNAVGGLALADGGLFAARRIDDSFAVARVPDQPGVRVYSENRLLGETDSNGRLLIHNLRAYEANRIAIDPRDLPLDAEIGRTQAEIAPRFRSGVTVEFPVRRTRAVMIEIGLPDGTVVPPGAVLRLNGGEEEFYVGLDGEAVLRGARMGDLVTVERAQGTCSFVLDREIPEEPMPDLGRFLCQAGG
ncbi:MAG: fimbria/pilus outer membrane usher protein [Kiloniellales bacterium]|nr:fimbria/pilus outer membrane usher protein [Kiloniellales bacterium]